MYTITVYNISRGIYVKGILYSPDAGHSGREESAEWLDLARGVTITAVHNIPPCSRDECGSEQLVRMGMNDTADNIQNINIVCLCCRKILYIYI